MSLPKLKIKLIKSGISAEFSNVEKTIKYKDLTGVFPSFRETIDVEALEDPKPVLIQMRNTINSLKTS